VFHGPRTSVMRRRLENLSRETGHAIAVRCVADGWSAEAVKCGLAAKDPQLECRGERTAPPRKKMNNASRRSSPRA
jgi:hypothetical protein